MNYEGRANGVVIVEWVLFILPLVTLAVVGGFYFDEIVATFQSYNENERNSAVICAVVISIVILIGFLWNYSLTHGVKKGRTLPLKVWYVLNIIFTVLYVIQLIMDLIAGVWLVSTAGALPLFIIIILKGGYLWYKIWSINVIMEFTKGLTSSSSGRGHGGVVYSIPVYDCNDKMSIIDKV